MTWKPYAGASLEDRWHIDTGDEVIVLYCKHKDRVQRVCDLANAATAALQEVATIIQEIRKFDCGAWLDLNEFSEKGRQKRIELMHLLDKLYVAIAPPLEPAAQEEDADYLAKVVGYLLARENPEKFKELAHKARAESLLPKSKSYE